MAQAAKEEKIKKAIEEELRKKVRESQEKKVVAVESDEELSDDGEFFLRDRPA